MDTPTFALTRGESRRVLIAPEFVLKHVSFSHDRNGNPSLSQSEQGRLRVKRVLTVRRCVGQETVRFYENNCRSPPTRCAPREPVSEARRQCRRDDAQVECICRWASTILQQARQRVVAGRLTHGKQLESPRPVSVEGTDGLILAGSIVDEHAGTLPARRVRSSDRSGGLHSYFEGRLSPGPGDRALLSIQDD